MRPVLKCANKYLSIYLTMFLFSVSASSVSHSVSTLCDPIFVWWVQDWNWMIDRGFNSLVPNMFSFLLFCLNFANGLLNTHFRRIYINNCFVLHDICKLLLEVTITPRESMAKFSSESTLWSKSWRSIISSMFLVLLLHIFYLKLSHLGTSYFTFLKTSLHVGTRNLSTKQLVLSFTFYVSIFRISRLVEITKSDPS